MTEPTVVVQIPKQFKELFNPIWRFITYWGGRAGGKSQAVATALLLRGRQKKLRILCTRQIQNTIKDSVHKLLKDQIDKYGFNDYRVTDDSIINTVTGTEFIFKGLLRNIQEIKSLEGIDICWCFPAGTLVDGTPIEKIKKGMLVGSFNHKTNKIEHRKVLNISKRKVPKILYKLLTQGGLYEIVATGEHPIYIKNKGYIPIKNIKKGDIVYAKKIEPTRELQVPGGLWGRHSDRYSRKKTKICQKGWNLLQGLCKKDELRKNEEEQPNGQQRITRKNESVIEVNEVSTNYFRWKWQRIYEATIIIIRKTWQRVVEGTNNYNRSGEKNKWLANKLQSGFSECLLYVSNRVRWLWASGENRKNGRRKERHILEEYGVDSIEIQEQGDIERYRQGDVRNYVYNLEVEVNNNYFANDVLVHNCEEAQTITEDNFNILTPTIRKEGSQIIFTFNRFTDLDPVYVRYVMNKPPKAFEMQVNYDVLMNLNLLPQVMIEEMEYDRDNNPDKYAHVWLGQPLAQGEFSALQRDEILAAMQRDIEDDGQIVVGVDVARMGNDRIVLWKRKGLKTIDFRVFEKLRINETVDEVKKFVDNNQEIKIQVDDTGVGGGVTDALMAEDYNVVAINFGAEPADKDKYPNLISEAWFYLGSIIKEIQLPMDQSLLMELSTRQYKIDSKEKRCIESKADYKKRGYRSPDLADACIICYYNPQVNEPDIHFL